MEQEPTATAYKAGFLGRVKAAREARFKAQEDLCVVLGIKQSLYSKYEVRSLMPHRLIPRFCMACTVTTEWLFTSKGAGPTWKPVYPSPQPRKKPRSRSRAA